MGRNDPEKAAIEVRVLGDFRATAPDGTTLNFPTQKARALFARLVIAGDTGLDRSTTAGMFWSRGTDAQARTNLRQTLASIRKAIGQDGVIESDGERIRVHDGSVRSDIGTLMADDRQQVLALIPGIGPLLSDISIDEPGFSDWLTRERATRRAQVSAVLFELADALMAEGEWVNAQVVNQKLLALDEFDEGFHRQAMRIHAGRGARAKALQHYDDLTALLERELDAKPSDATQALAETLKSADATETAPAPPDPSDAHDKTRLIVLPFEEHGGEFADGFGRSLAEEIAVELGRFATLSVARAEAHGAEASDSGYRVGGSVRASGDRLRVTLHLTDNASGNLIWSDRHDEPIRDSLDLLEDIVRRVVATIPGRVQVDVAESTLRTGVDALGAHELMLRGKMLRDTLSVAAMDEARDVLERAVALDPTNARAQMYLSDTYIIDAWLGVNTEGTSDKALHHARLAIAADHSDVFIQDHLGFALLCNGMWQDGRAQIEKALAKIQHEVESNAWCGYALSILGDHEAALREVLKATARDQMPLATFGWIRAQVFSFNGRYDDTINELRGVSVLNSLAQAFLVGAYSRTGRKDEASAALAEFVKMRRGELEGRGQRVSSDNVDELAGGFRGMWRRAEDWEHIADGLALAGLARI